MMRRYLRSLRAGRGQRLRGDDRALAAGDSGRPVPGGVQAPRRRLAVRREGRFRRGRAKVRTHARFGVVVFKVMAVVFVAAENVFVFPLEAVPISPPAPIQPLALAGSIQFP